MGKVFANFTVSYKATLTNDTDYNSYISHINTKVVEFLTLYVAVHQKAALNGDGYS